VNCTLSVSSLKHNFDNAFDIDLANCQTWQVSTPLHFHCGVGVRDVGVENIQWRIFTMQFKTGGKRPGEEENVLDSVYGLFVVLFKYV
jgi:hypothetical protein